MYVLVKNFPPNFDNLFSKLPTFNLPVREEDHWKRLIQGDSFSGGILTTKSATEGGLYEWLGIRLLNLGENVQVLMKTSKQFFFLQKMNSVTYFTKGRFYSIYLNGLNRLFLYIPIIQIYHKSLLFNCLWSLFFEQ